MNASFHIRSVRVPRVRFYLEKRMDKTTKNIITANVPVLFSLSYGGRYKSSAGIRLDADLWDQENQRVKSSHTHANIMNKMLSDFRKELQDICYDAWDKNIRLTSEYISGKLQKHQTSARGFFAMFDEYIDAHKANEWQDNTTKIFNNIKGHLSELSEKKHIKVEFDSMDANFFEKLINFYFEDKKMINSTVRKNIKFIKFFLKWAADKGYNKNTAFINWKLRTGNKKEDTSDNIVSLTISEFMAVYNLQPKSKVIERTRDYMILACSTGLRYSDIANLKKTDVNYQQGIISCTTIKGGEKAVIPFNDFSREILEKYRGTPNYNQHGVEMALEVTSNQKLNDALKTLAEDAGINDPVTIVKYQRNRRTEKVSPKYTLITTHIGRKTFITFNVWLGVQAEITMGLTTHRNHETMEAYYKVNLDMKRDAMGKFSKENLLMHINAATN